MVPAVARIVARIHISFYRDMPISYSSPQTNDDVVHNIVCKFMYVVGEGDTNL